MEQKKNPLLIGLLTAIPSVISAITGIIKDKKEKKEEATINPPTDATDATTGDIISNSIKDITSGTISLKRSMNIGGTTLIILLAITDINSHGLTKMNLTLIGIGAVYSLGMSLLTFLSEKK